MAKKEFKSGLDFLIGSTGEYEKPIKKEEQNKPGKEKEIRATFIVNEEQLFKIKAIAYWERKEIKAILKEAFELYINSKLEEDLKTAIQKYSLKYK